MQEEWGMIKQYMKATKEETDAFREDLKATLKERFDSLTAQIISEGHKRDDHMKQIDDRLYKHKAEFLIATELVDKRVSRLKDTLGRITFWMVTALITFATAWGGLSAIVATNTQKWSELEPEHKQILQDVEVLKEKSLHGTVKV
jgi:hypothetical protein